MMNLQPRSRRLARASAVVLAVVVAFPPGPAALAADPQADDTLRLAAAQRLDAKADAIREEARGSVVLGGRSYLAGYFSAMDGPAIRVVVDPTSGRVLDDQTFENLVEDARAAADKFAPSTRAALADGNQHEVGFFLKGLDYTAAVAGVEALHPEVTWEAGRPISGRVESLRAARMELMLAKAAVVRVAAKAFAAEAELVTGDLATTYELAPIVIVRASRAQAEGLAARGDVAEVRLSVAPEVAMGSSYVDLQTSYSHDPAILGLSGTGVKLGLVEYGRINWSAPNLASVGANKTVVYVGGVHPNFTCTTTQPTPLSISNHWTRVAAIAAGRLASGARGTAPAAHIVAASTGKDDTLSQDADRRFIKAVECALLNGADLISASVVMNVDHTIGETYFDHLVYEHRIFAVAAAGNQTATGQQHCPSYVVRSPGSGWNVLTVGGMNDNNETTLNWANDEPWYQAATGSAPSYCYLQPPPESWDSGVNDRVKPEILAPAQQITVVGIDTQSGTSFATPMAAGAAALVLEQDPGLVVQPETLKAILIAGTRVHRVDPRGAATYSTELEGAGTLSPKWANLLVRGATPGGTANLGGYGLLTLTSPGTQGGPCYVAPALRTVTFQGSGGRKIRFVIVWDAHTASHPGHTSTGNFRYANLNLSARRPDGANQVSDATSHRNKVASNVEWMDFTVSQVGVHTAEISTAGWGCEVPSERVGYAWVSFSAP